MNQNRPKNKIYKDIYREILRICSRLDLSIGFSKGVFEVIKKIWSLHYNKIERDPVNLVPVIIYRITRRLEITIDLKLLVSTTKCSKKIFKDILISPSFELPPLHIYGLIFGKINRICKKIRIPFNFKIRAIKILRANYSILEKTTSSIAASTVLSLSVISLGSRKNYRLYKIAGATGTSISAIQVMIFRLLKSRGIDLDNKIKNLYSWKFNDIILSGK